MESNSPSASPRPKETRRLPDVGNTIEPNHLRVSQVATSSSPRMEGDGASMEIELPLKKKAGLIRLLGAPILDLSEAQRQVSEEKELDEKAGLSSAEDGKEEDTMVSSNVSTPAEVSHVNTHDAEYLDGANEETFTLETFESLIRNSRRAGKAFLLARVTTVDPKNLSRLYYSYYSAYQINKVIFRTQPEEGLLHRMRSKNPLNNMSIVGDVHYFAISPQEFDRAWQLQDALKEQRSVLRSSMSVTSGSGGNSPFSLTRNSSTHITRGGRDLRKSIFRNHSFSHRRHPQEGEILTADPDAALHAGEPGTYSVPEMSQVDSQVDLSHLDETVDDSMSVIYEAQYFASDDDFLMRSDVREFFKINSVAPDDYLLFQLNRPTGTPYEMMILGPDGRPLFRGSHPVPAPRPRPGIRHLWGLLDDGDHSSMVCRLHCGILSPLGFWLLVIIGSAVGVFCGLVYVPAPNNFLMFGGILCIYILMMLLFVNWGADEASAAIARNTARPPMATRSDLPEQEVPRTAENAQTEVVNNQSEQAAAV